MMRLTLAVLGGACVLMLVVPDVAHACPVCFDSREENRQAFLATTAFLSLFPLGLVAGAGIWVSRRFREQDEAFAEEGEAPDAAEVWDEHER